MTASTLARRALRLVKKHAREVQATQPFHADKAALEVACPPTPAQSQAGNYRKGHVKIHGLSIAIETPAGGLRRKVAKEGHELWRVTMPAHYGYVKGSRGADGDQVDVFVGPHPFSPRVFVIDQVKEDGSFDEHKCMLGFWHRGDALNCYDASFSDKKGPQRRKNVSELTVSEFKRWVNSPATKEPLKPLGKMIWEGGLSKAGIPFPLRSRLASPGSPACSPATSFARRSLTTTA
jgi:hypothetical protein